jgi:hypothetical protein
MNGIQSKEAKYLMSIEKETGPIRRYWNYFKRGKSEINFLLNIYQTIVIIWGASNKGNIKALMIFTVFFGILLFVASIVIGKYSLTKVDPSLPYINPFAQDVTVYRSHMAAGMDALAADNRVYAMNCFSKAEAVLKRWINDD